MIFTPPYDPNEPCVLCGGFPGFAHVDHGPFWGQNTGTDLGTGFWWDAWVRPLATSGYLVSAGYGGSHPLLWGLSGGQTGNIWNGSANTSFVGTYAPAVGEWVYLRVVWDASKVFTSVNGVGDGVGAFAGPRVTAGQPESGRLYVFGSDHQPLYADLAALRGYDRALPGQGIYNFALAFRPERSFGWAGYGNLLADFLPDYSHPTVSGYIPDHAPVGCVGYTGGPSQRHPGRLIGESTVGAIDLLGTPYGAADQRGRKPYWVQDGTCPYGRPVGSPLPAESVPAPGAVPGGCLAFDSFGRRNQTFAFQHALDLGSTEGGSRGPLAWNTSAADVWGILGGAAYHAGNAAAQSAWVDLGTANQDVRVSCLRQAGSYNVTGLTCRQADGNNFWFAFTWGDPGSGGTYMRYGNVVAGVVNEIGTALAGTGWDVLRMVTNGTTITIYADATELVTLTGQTTLQSATKAGICGADLSFLCTSHGRYRNWTAYAA